MKKIMDFIVDKRKWFLVCFLVLAIAGAVASFLVKVNYDMTVYLPKNAETTKAMEIMYEEFGDNGTITVMIPDVDLSEALSVKTEIVAVQNIKGVIWLDTVLLEYKGAYEYMTGATVSDEQFLQFIFSLYNNPEMIPPEMLPMLSVFDGFYKDGKALYQVTFIGSAFDASTVAAIDEIKEIVGNANMAGAAASSYAMQTAIEKELGRALIIIIPALLLILFIATTSFFDPFIFIAVIAIAILLNIGTNFLLGSISYLTNSIAMVFQLAISMDYAIFFLHTFKAQRKKGLSATDGAKAALAKSLSPISASSLTTIAGFLAMLFMRYTIGFDMGIVMAKAIVFSLLSVFLFMPGFVVFTSKAIDKLEHRSILSFFKRKQKVSQSTNSDVPLANLEQRFENGSILTAIATVDSVAKPLSEAIPKDSDASVKIKPTFGERFAGGIVKLRYILPVIFIVVAVLAFFGQNNNDFQYGQLATAGGEGSTLMTDKIKIEETFGSQNNAVILLSNNYADKEYDLTVKLLGLTLDGKNYITSAQSYSFLAVLGDVPAYMESQFLGDHYRRIILVVDTPEESDEAFAVADEMRRLMDIEMPDGGYYIMGDTLTTQDIKTINESDYSLVILLTLVFILTILLVTFRSPMIMIILGIVIQGAIWINMSIPFLLSEPLVFLGYLIASCIQMGCTIDYGILLSSNYNDYRKSTNKKSAAIQAFLSTIGAITTSAAILATVGFVVGMTGTTPAVASLGMLLGRGTIISYLAMMFVLPQLLVLFDKPIRLSTLKLTQKSKRLQ
jgi:predicted RND superfamily exporter protein